MDLDSRGRGPRIGGATAAGHARAGAMGVAAGAAGIPSRAAGAGVVTAHVGVRDAFGARARGAARFRARPQFGPGWNSFTRNGFGAEDRKSTRLNSSHVAISYAVFCLKKKKNYLKRKTYRSLLNLLRIS